MKEIKELSFKELAGKKRELEEQMLESSCKLLFIHLALPRNYNAGKGKTRRYFVKKYAKVLQGVLDETIDSAIDETVVMATQLLLQAKVGI